MAAEEDISFQKNLAKYIGDSAAIFVESETRGLVFHLKVTKSRQTKYGDYMESFHGKKQRITVNGNLDKYSFLITLLHELAHLKAFDDYGRRIKPHGIEWKNTFSSYLVSAIKNELFPKDIAEVVHYYYVVKNDYSSRSRSKIVDRINFSLNILIPTRLEAFPINSCLNLTIGMTVKIIEKRRTRYLCKDLSSNKMYLVNKEAEVESIIE
jgi:predicted SprT family Zn-dependent metalloprotease